MRKRYSILVVVALAVVGVAWSWTAQANCPSSTAGSQPVSWFVTWEGNPEEVVIVPEVPGATGVVITAVIMPTWNRGHGLVQRDEDGDDKKAELIMNGISSNNSHLVGSLVLTLGSGIPFCAGSSIVLAGVGTTTPRHVTIIGYTYYPNQGEMRWDSTKAANARIVGPPSRPFITRVSMTSRSGLQWRPVCGVLSPMRPDVTTGPR